MADTSNKRKGPDKKKSEPNYAIQFNPHRFDGGILVGEFIIFENNKPASGAKVVYEVNGSPVVQEPETVLENGRRPVVLKIDPASPVISVGIRQENKPNGFKAKFENIRLPDKPAQKPARSWYPKIELNHRGNGCWHLILGAYYDDTGEALEKKFRFVFSRNVRVNGKPLMRLLKPGEYELRVPVPKVGRVIQIEVPGPHLEIDWRVEEFDKCGQIDLAGPGPQALEAQPDDSFLVRLMDQVA